MLKYFPQVITKPLIWKPNNFSLVYKIFHKLSPIKIYNFTSYFSLYDMPNILANLCNI